MQINKQEDKTIYKVVVNHEEQYSIWPVDRELPLGWEEAGKQGIKEECCAYIEEVWTDMRPLSLRKKMDEIARQSGNDNPKRDQDGSVQTEESALVHPYRDQLVQYLAEGNHPIIASRADNSVEKFKESISRGYVLIKFTDTQGGTELGIRLNREKTALSQADFEQGRGITHLEGTLTLNYVKVQCLVDIDLATLQGQGHLVVLEYPGI